MQYLFNSHILYDAHIICTNYICDTIDSYFTLSLIVFFEKLELKYNTDLKIIRHFIRCRIYEKSWSAFCVAAS